MANELGMQVHPGMRELRAVFVAGKEMEFIEKVRRAGFSPRRIKAGDWATLPAEAINNFAGEADLVVREEIYLVPEGQVVVEVPLGPGKAGTDNALKAREIFFEKKSPREQLGGILRKIFRRG